MGGKSIGSRIGGGIGGAVFGFIFGVGAGIFLNQAAVISMHGHAASYVVIACVVLGILIGALGGRVRKS